MTAITTPGTGPVTPTSGPALADSTPIRTPCRGTPRRKERVPSMGSSSQRTSGIMRWLGTEIRPHAVVTADGRERVVAAMTAMGAFREDLFYRLNVVEIVVPPLRDRGDDVLKLAEHFVGYFAEKTARVVDGLTPAARAALVAHRWPGNVRELQNVMEHAVVVLEPGEEIQPNDIPFLDDGIEGSALGGWSLGPDIADVEYHTAREKVLTEFELQYLSSLIDRAGTNMSRAAKMAGIDRTTLYRLMEKHGLQRDTVIKPA